MKGSLLVAGVFVAGVLLGRFAEVPAFLLEGKPTLYALYALVLLAGISIGSDREALRALRRQSWRVLLVPVGTWGGTLAGAGLVSLVLPGRSLADCLAVGAGFGYYSLSSVFITQYKGAELGTIALVSNVMRELVALVGAPLLVKYFGKLAPISVGGATTADTTLPVIVKCCGTEFVAVSVVHGVLVDLSVPFLVSFFCSF